MVRIAALLAGSVGTNKLELMGIILTPPLRKMIAAPGFRRAVGKGAKISSVFADSTRGL
jgi:hypothetical protein